MRLIDADALIKDAFDLMDRNELLEDVPQIIKDYCDAQPTVDAVPVIRCINCRYYEELLVPEGDHNFIDERCTVSGMPVTGADYCSKAVKGNV